MQSSGSPTIGTQMVQAQPALMANGAHCTHRHVFLCKAEQFCYELQLLLSTSRTPRKTNPLQPKNQQLC